MKIRDLVQISVDEFDDHDGLRGIIKHIGQDYFGVEIISTYSDRCGEIIPFFPNQLTLISES